MADIRAYWGRVNARLASLPPDEVLFVTSLDNPERAGGVTAGRVSEVRRKHAAELIVMNTHRLSTPEEITAYHTEAKVRSEDIAEKEYQRKQNFALPREVANLVAAAVQGAAPKQRRGES